MANDYSGGIPFDREEVFAEAPENPEMRDSVSFWVSDDQGYFGIPRIGIEAEGRPWETHGFQAQMGFSDGRIYVNTGQGPTHPALDGQGRPYIIGAGPLSFQCIEPFERWVARFDGEMKSFTAERLTREMSYTAEAEMVPVSFEVEATIAAPPWVQGDLLPEAAEVLKQVEGDFMGGPRYEQLFTAAGRVQVEGEDYTFTGSGLRIRRQGVRNLPDFWGHAWQSALFPSGRGFGYIAYPPRKDGKPTYNEGYIREPNGELIGARVIDAPWLKRLLPKGDDVSVTLETIDGHIVRIEGETIIPIHHIGNPMMPDFPPLAQNGCRYTWDGEVTYGMLERSSMKDVIEWPS